VESLLVVPCPPGSALKPTCSQAKRSLFHRKKGNQIAMKMTAGAMNFPTDFERRPGFRLEVTANQGFDLQSIIFAAEAS
jgi:hypothetical protein